MNSEAVLKYKNQLPESFYKHAKDFVFLDFEVFKYDWLVCFSVDGIHIKSIVNDAEKLKDLFLNKFKDRVLMAYNGNRYDKYIMLAILNDIDPKQVNDDLINSFNFNFNYAYGDQIEYGQELIWYDPSTDKGGSLKTYEACEGEDIYESEVDFNLDRKLTPEEISETIKYCSFDVQMLIKYFYEVNFDSFLGHIGLIEQTINARPYMEFYKCLPKTDASLVGQYLCTKQGDDPTTETDTIELPSNILLGKYESQIKELLTIPIKILKNGEYNDLNSWSVKLIEKSIAAASGNSDIDKLNNKINKKLEKIKKLKIEINELKVKEKLTAKQTEKLNTHPTTIANEINELQLLRNDLNSQLSELQELKDLVDELKNYKKDTANYNYILSKIVEKANVSDNNKKLVLINYLRQSDQELYNLKYLTDKTLSQFNGILKTYPFEVVLNIKNIPHSFKTGGIHSVYASSLFFDNTTEKDKGKRLIIADVGSLYPNLMRVFELCSIGMDDPKMFAQMIFDRIVLKKKKDPFANVLKLILNTTYGCMGSAFNYLYDPTNRLKVCIFGQCALVDLLDKLEDKVPSLEIYQSNTDGIIVSCIEEEYDTCEEIIHEWEARTGLEMEIDQCSKLIQRDVSNYILIKNK